MFCPACRARNSPAATICHACGAALDRPADQQIDQRSDDTGSSTRMRGRGVMLGIIGVATLAVLVLLPWPIGNWMGEQVLKSKRSNPELQAVEDRYEIWKRAHALHVDVLMRCYARDAVIIRETGQRENYNDLLQLARQVRQNRAFDSVRDLEPPQIVITGNKAEIWAKHRYGHSNAQMTPWAGERRLIWKKRNGQWLIVEDHFPTQYTPVK
jgi:ketosteroid isomerase-like protein